MAQLLENTQVLIFDCQATSACCSGGQLLETGWCVHRAVRTTPPDTTEMETYRIQLPEDTPIPPAVEKITGITEPNAPAAISPATAWRLLGEAAAGLAAGSERNLPLCVIHYARFERPYLKNLHNDFGHSNFPFHIVCTHEIARRLLPHLPRKGLRALAGYFGYPVSRLRRSAHHVAATAVIWSRLTALLKKDRQIDTAADLLNWLEKPVSKCPRNWWEILGLKFWQEAAERDRSESDPDEEDPAKNSMQKERFREPEIVANALESVVRRGAHLIRRSRWFTLLSESTLAWNRPDNRLAAVMLSGGVIEKRFFLSKDASIPTSSDSLRRCRQRLQQMDIAAYDRLRVLTTELRRLVKQNRKPTLVSGSRRPWETEQLAEILFWL